MIRATILGTGTFPPSKQRKGPGILLEFDSRKVLVDGAPDIYQNLIDRNIDINSIDVIFVTHCHLDHVGGIGPLIYAMFFAERKRPLTVYGPPGMREYYQKFNELQPDKGAFFEKNRQFPVHLAEVHEGLCAKREFDAYAFELKHSAKSFGYRFVYKGTEIAIAGDTEYCPALERLFNKVKFGTIECSSELPTEFSHMYPESIGALARRTEPGTVVVLHMPPTVREKVVTKKIKEIYTGKIVVARDGQKFTI